MVLPPSEFDFVPSTNTPGHQPDRVAVVAALRRMLESVEFRGAPKSQDFLTYVVSEALAGRGDRLKGRTVARYALGRSETFDSTTDAAARVQAHRLRAILQRYYAGTGSNELTVIDLPLGSYLPSFSHRVKSPSQETAVPLEPGLAVVQFVELNPGDGSEPMATGLTESLVHALGAFPGLRVIGPVAGDRGVGILPEVMAAARALDVQYVLTGVVRSTPTVIRLMIRLSDGQSGEVVWSDVSDQQRSAVTGFHDEDALIERIAATVGDFRGVVLRDASVRRAGTRLPAAHTAMLSYYRYLDTGTQHATHAAARDLLAAAKADSENHVLGTMLGSIEYVLAIMGWTQDRETALTNAERRAREALTRHCGYSPAWTVLAAVALAREDCGQCQRHARHAIELSPFHPSILYSAGVLLAISGAWDEGLEAIRESSRLNPHHPGYQHAYMALDCLKTADYNGMLAEASLLTEPDDHWGPLLRFMALSRLGHLDRAQEEYEALRAIDPRLFEQDGAAVMTQLQDVPHDIRSLIREALIDWLE